MPIKKHPIFIAICVTALATLSACDSIIDDRIPAYPVSINLGDAGLWNAYGVAGYGTYQYFVKDAKPSLPIGFPYPEASYTGFGGVLLIGGMDPYTGETSAFLAYDLACPVELRSNVRVQIDPQTYNAICPSCGSVYDVCMAGGAPISGEAATLKYRLQNYSVLGTQYGGYIILR